MDESAPGSPLPAPHSPPSAPSIAVVGASANREKFGNTCVRAYLRRGWTVYPINPRETEIEGLRVWRSVEEIGQPVETVSLYVPPGRVGELLDGFRRAGVREVFFNPGTEDMEAMDRARAMGMKVIEACAIVSLGSQG